MTEFNIKFEKNRIATAEASIEDLIDGFEKQDFEVAMIVFKNLQETELCICNRNLNKKDIENLLIKLPEYSNGLAHND